MRLPQQNRDSAFSRRACSPCRVFKGRLFLPVVREQIASWPRFVRKIVGSALDGQPSKSLAHSTDAQEVTVADGTDADDSEIACVKRLPALRAAHLPAGCEVEHGAPWGGNNG